MISMQEMHEALKDGRIYKVTVDGMSRVGIRFKNYDVSVDLIKDENLQDCLSLLAGQMEQKQISISDLHVSTR